ncbi:MAG: hypothetical protein LUG64_02210 [Clostridiales bacterium]|nr:hypothetical protein [Clostridiales bacterium]
MNKALEKAAEEAARTKALLWGLELVAKDIDVPTSDMEAANNAIHLLYLAQETAEKVVEELDELQRDI